MLTARGFWLLLFAFALAFAGVVGVAWWSPTFAVLPLTLLLWFAFEWGLFAVRQASAVGRLEVDRRLYQGGREVPGVWAGVDVTVKLTVTLRGKLRLPFAAVADKLPAGSAIETGTRRAVAELVPNEPLTVEYVIRPEFPGGLRFEGVELRQADLCGFFYHRAFLRQPVEYLVLPPLSDDEGGQRALKRFNTLPPPGVHRMKKAGGGDELLDLREYRAGDPPKMVAWKASARRDLLITKEFETDVPVRCTLFVDASDGLRLGEPGQTPLARLCGLAAAVAQAASANRDLVGLTVFDEREAKTEKPARTRLHTMGLLRTLADTAAKLPHGEAATDAEMLRRRCYSVAQELYPDLLAKRVNARPITMFWLPLLDSRARWLLVLPAVAIAAAVLFWKETLNLLFEVSRNVVHPRKPWDLIPFFGFAALLALSPITLTGVYWLLFGVRGFLPGRSKPLSRNKQLGAVFASLDADSPAAIERYIHDEPFFVARANRFLADHRVPPPPQLYDKQGEYRFRGEGKVTVLAAALVRAVGLARDNELYVILADLNELDEHLEPLAKAVRAAVGRRHKVLVLLPWPDGMPPPADKGQPAHGERPRKGKRRVTLGAMVRGALAGEYHRRFEAVRLSLVRAGAGVFRIDQADPVKLVLARLDRARGVRVRR